MAFLKPVVFPENDVSASVLCNKCAVTRDASQACSDRCLGHSDSLILGTGFWRGHTFSSVDSWLKRISKPLILEYHVKFALLLKPNEMCDVELNELMTHKLVNQCYSNVLLPKWNLTNGQKYRVYLFNFR
jgi:hypothetical protein